MRLRSLAVILLGAGLAGCGSTTFSSQDVRVHTAGETLYLLARSDDVSRSLCGSLGGDVAQAEARWAIEGRSMQLGRVSGCHTVRHVIVCSEDDAACMAHEERHRTLGAYHP
jgi:hypothetical protein